MWGWRVSKDEWSDPFHTSNTVFRGLAETCKPELSTCMSIISYITRTLYVHHPFKTRHRGGLQDFPLPNASCVAHTLCNFHSTTAKLHAHGTHFNGWYWGFDSYAYSLFQYEIIRLSDNWFDTYLSWSVLIWKSPFDR